MTSNFRPRHWEIVVAAILAVITLYLSEREGTPKSIELASCYTDHPVNTTFCVDRGAGDHTLITRPGE